MANESSSDIDLKKALADAQLSALPQSAIRLLELSQDPANGPDEFAIPIESDPGLAGQVLRFVNSSYFGFSREIATVKLAITLVGIRTIKNFALWSAVFSLMPNPRCGPFDLKSLWQDSLRRALFGRELARLLGASDPEESFVAALLQDMAVPLLAKEMPQAYAKLLLARHDGRYRLSDLEKKFFGWTHADAAGLMARQWNLPDRSAVLMENHLDIDRWISQSAAPPDQLAVSLSALLPPVGDSTWVERARFEDAYERIRPSSAPPARQMLEQIDEAFGQFAPTLKISTPRKALVDCYEEALDPSATPG